MATPSSILAWKIPWTEEPRSLSSIRLQIVGHDLVSDLLNLCFLCVLSFFLIILIRTVVLGEGVGVSEFLSLGTDDVLVYLVLYCGGWPIC